LQLYAPEHSGLSSAFDTVEQLPEAQLSQAALQLELQQRPSLQKPLTHSPAPPQLSPLTFLHWPAPSQLLAPLHSGSS